MGWRDGGAGWGLKKGRGRIEGDKGRGRDREGTQDTPLPNGFTTRQRHTLQVTPNATVKLLQKD